MRSGYKITLSILTIMILVTIAIGTSYAFFSVSGTQSGTNTLSTTCFSVSFTDGDSISLNEAGSYAYPMSDASAESLDPYIFTITNTCGSGADIKYMVILSTYSDNESLANALSPTLIRYSLGTNSSSIVKTLGEQDTYDLSNISDDSLNDLGTAYILAEGTLAADSNVEYNLRLWINESAGNDVMDQTFTGKILVYSYM